MPSERSAKSAIVVPAVVVATMTNQYRNGWNAFAAIWAMTATTKMPMKMMLLSAYPRFSDMETASPPVSPNVVARILMNQKASVTSGTLLGVASMAPFTSAGAWVMLAFAGRWSGISVSQSRMVDFAA